MSVREKALPQVVGCVPAKFDAKSVKQLDRKRLQRSHQRDHDYLRRKWGQRRERKRRDLTWFLRTSHGALRPKEDSYWRTSRYMWGLNEPAANMAGLGPFSFKMVESERLVLVRNPFFWKVDSAGRRLPYLDRITVHRRISYSLKPDGQMDTDPRADIIPWPQNFAKRLADLWTAFGSLNGYKLHVDGPSSSTTILILNQDTKRRELRSLFRNVLFRRALALAIDKNALSEQFAFGGIPRSSTVNFYSPAQRDDLLPKYPFDPSHAITLLTSIGVQDLDGDGWVESQDGVRVSFSILVDSGNSVHRTTAQMLRTYFGDIGISLEIEELPSAILQSRVSQREPDFEAVIRTFRDDPLYPAVGLSVLFWHLHEPTHAYRRSDARTAFDELPEAQRQLLRLAELYRTEPDWSRWLTIVHEAQRVAAEDLAVIPLASGRSAYLIKRGLQNADRIEGWSPSVFGRLPYLWWGSSPEVR